MEKTIDCVVCGSCVADILVRPVPLEQAIGSGVLMHTDPIEVVTGGIVSNSSAAMARLGMKVAAFTYVGRDEWGTVIRRRLEADGIDASGLMVHPTTGTSTTAVLIDPSGERSFAHNLGAPKLMDKKMYLANMELFARSRMALVGYYSMMPMEADLPEVFAAMHEVGCMTGLDAAGDGGGMKPLDRILPQVDVYVPSYSEAVHQTNEKEPERIIERFRNCGAPGMLGVKLGSKGALLSPKAGEYVRIEAVKAPGPVVDTTGAGDSFLGGLVTGMLRGLSVQEAGRLGAAAGACCVTGMGGTAGLRGREETYRLAGLPY